MNRKFFEELLWFAVLVMLGVLLAKLLLGGGIAIFLSPRMFKFVWFALAVLVLISLNQIRNVIKALSAEAHGQKGVKLYSFIFLIPLFLAYTAMPSASTAQSIDNRTVDMAGAVQQQNDNSAAQGTPAPTTNNGQSPAPEDDTAPVVGDDISAIEPCLQSEEPVLKSDGDLMDYFADYVYSDIEQLDDKPLTICGYVYKDDSFPQNTLLVSRLLISCCAADASLVGYHVKVENAGDFAEDEWMQVSGTVEVVNMEIEGAIYELPVINGGTICHIEAFDTPYIYP